MLSDSQKQQYARQLLLVEIGEVGQQRLCDARLAIDADADPRAASVAADYLRRAGCTLSAASDGRRVEVPTAARVAALAGDEGLREAAAWLAGAFAAVEAIKQITASGRPAVLPATLGLSTGTSSPAFSPACSRVVSGPVSKWEVR